MRKYLGTALLLFWYLGLPVLAFIFSPRILQDFKDSDYGLWLAMRSDLWGIVIMAGWAFLPMIAQKIAKWYYWDAILSEKMIAIVEESGNLAAMLKVRMRRFLGYGLSLRGADCIFRGGYKLRLLLEMVSQSKV